MVCQRVRTLIHSDWSDGSTGRASIMFIARFRFGAGARAGTGFGFGSERPQFMHSAPVPGIARLVSADARVSRCGKERTAAAAARALPRNDRKWLVILFIKVE